AAGRLAVQWGHRYFAELDAADRSTFRTLKHIEAETLAETIRPFAGPLRVEKYIASFNEYLARPTLFEEVREVLARLRVPVCIVSNADDRELQAALSHHGLHFDWVVSSESARSYKPQPGIFAAALELTGWSPDRVIHVGDSLHSDVGGAHGVGLKAAWVNRSIRISDIGSKQPDFTWSDLRPLVELTCGR
ncbi:MAG: HAD family hydrolase, partial [Planctomycetes bacterium]|nr:HAD family hydrolase [Planctomycetota bacterium]